MSDFEAIFVDVGQGDTTLVRLPGGTCLLVDIFRSPQKGIDVFRLLDDVLPDGDDGRKRIEILAITHAHEDHITGISDLYDRYQVGRLWLPQHGDNLAIASNFEDFMRVRDEHPKDLIDWPGGSRSVWTTLGDQDQVEVRCYSPPGYIDSSDELDADEAERLVHENCVVLKLTFSAISVMLTGDSNKPCWQRITGYYSGRQDDEGLGVLSADILHASHHGSRTFIKDSKDDATAYLEALESISPEAVVVSVGADNPHDHPHDDMIAAYSTQVGASNVFETHKLGTMRLEVETDGTARLVTDDGERYAQDYGWDLELPDGPDGGGAKGQHSVPPSAPAPGYESVPQRAPQRERYGD